MSEYNNPHVQTVQDILVAYAEKRGFVWDYEDPDGAVNLHKRIGPSTRYLEITTDGLVNGEEGDAAKREIRNLAAR